MSLQDFWKACYKFLNAMIVHVYQIFFMGANGFFYYQLRDAGGKVHMTTKMGVPNKDHETYTLIYVEFI